MSNKVVPQTYRAIIDKVINSVRPDFEENGVEDAVLVALQQSWEAKLAMSRVTDFSSDPRLGAYQRMLPPEEPKSAPVPPSETDKQAAASANGSTSQGDGDVKPSADATSTANAASTSTNPAGAESSTASTSTSASAGGGEGSGSQKAANTAPSKPAPDPDSNEIGSDLDDDSDEDLLSDEDDPTGENGANGLGGAGDERGDVIIALYEKVQRVKNKWKITLKDGVISAEGKDYLFNKCQGDFEW